MGFRLILCLFSAVRLIAWFVTGTALLYDCLFFNFVPLSVVLANGLADKEK